MTSVRGLNSNVGIIYLPSSQTLVKKSNGKLLEHLQDILP